MTIIRQITAQFNDKIKVKKDLLLPKTIRLTWEKVAEGLLLRAYITGYTSNDKFLWEIITPKDSGTILNENSLNAKLIPVSEDTLRYRVRFWVNKHTSGVDYKDLNIILPQLNITLEVTSQPYPYFASESFLSSLSNIAITKSNGRLNTLFLKSENISSSITNVSLYRIPQPAYNNWIPESITSNLSIVFIQLRTVLKSYALLPDSISTQMSISSIEVRRALINYTGWIPESISTNLTLSFLSRIPGNNSGGITALNFNDSLTKDLNFLQSWSITGNVNLTESIKKYGSSAAIFDGTTNTRLTSAGYAQNTLGTLDFCIEFWLYRQVTQNGVILDARVSNNNVGLLIIFNNSDPTKLNVFIGDSTPDWEITLLSQSISLNTWTHFAITRQSNTFNLFQNGVVVSTQNSISLNVSNSSILNIGNNLNGNNGYLGILDMFRIIKNNNVYTNNFDPEVDILLPETLGIY